MYIVYLIREKDPKGQRYTRDGLFFYTCNNVSPVSSCLFWPWILRQILLKVASASLSFSGFSFSLACWHLAEQNSDLLADPFVWSHTEPFELKRTTIMYKHQSNCLQSLWRVWKWLLGLKVDRSIFIRITSLLHNLFSLWLARKKHHQFLMVHSLDYVLHQQHS